MHLQTATFIYNDAIWSPKLILWVGALYDSPQFEQQTLRMNSKHYEMCKSVISVSRTISNIVIIIIIGKMLNSHLIDLCHFLSKFFIVFSHEPILNTIFGTKRKKNQIVDIFVLKWRCFWCRTLYVCYNN